MPPLKKLKKTKSLETPFSKESVYERICRQALEHPALWLYVCAWLGSWLCFFPLVFFSTKKYSIQIIFSESVRQHVFVGICMALALQNSKLYEFIFDMIHAKQKIYHYIPHSFGYLITFTTAFVCLIIASRLLFLEGWFWYGNLSLQIIQIITIAAYCGISAATNPLRFSILKMQCTQVLLFSLSNACLTWAMMTHYSPRKLDFYDKYINISLLCSVGNIIIQVVFYMMKSSMFAHQFYSIDQVWVNRWDWLSFAAFNIVYFSLRTLVIWTYGYRTIQPNNSRVAYIGELLYCQYLLFGIYLVMFSHVPHRQTVSHLEYVKEELETKDSFVTVHLHDMRSPLSTIVQGIDVLSTIVKNLRYQHSRSSDTHAVSATTANSEIFKSFNEAEDIIRDVNLSCGIAISQLNDFLLFDKIKHDKLGVLELAMVQPSGFVTDCIRPFYIQAKASEMTISTTFSSYSEEQLTLNIDNITILIDAPKVQHVLRNLLSNALKFSPKGGNIIVNVMTTKSFSSAPIWPSKQAENSVGTLRIEVVDQGPGISQENQETLFGKYVQINANKLQGGGGSGLGLWSSKEVVELHGGVIGVISEGEGKGSSFFFEIPCYNNTPSVPEVIDVTASPEQRRRSTISSNALPLAHEVVEKAASLPNFNSTPIQSQRVLVDDDKVRRLDIATPILSYETSPKSYHKEISPTNITNSPSPEKFQSVEDSPAHKRKQRILMVDDSTMPLKMAQRYLREEYDVDIVATSAIEALRLVDEKGITYFDIIMTDFFMPGMTGPELCRALKTKSYHGLIIGVTGSSTTKDRIEFIESGAHTVLVKPVKLIDVTKAVEGWNMDLTPDRLF